jgi:hypothetical protein
MSEDQIDWDEGRVLRFFPAGSTDEEMRCELAGADAAWRSGAPVAAVYGIEMAKGRVGLIEDRVDGITLLQVLSASPWQARQRGVEFAELQLRLGSLAAPDELPDIKVRLRQALTEADLDEHLRQRLATRMDSLPDGDRLLHGALQPSVVVLHETGPIVTHCGALSQGHPDADVAITLVHLALAVPPANARLWPLLDRARRTFLGSYERTIAARLPRHDAAAWVPVIAATKLADANDHERVILRRLIDGAAIR